jgi:hypothetical protein
MRIRTKFVINMSVYAVTATLMVSTHLPPIGVFHINV